MMDTKDMLYHMQDLIAEIESGGWTEHSEIDIRVAYRSLRDAVMKVRCDDLFQVKEIA
jgi:hypothetical protein